MIETAKRILSRIRGGISKEDNTREENAKTSPTDNVPLDPAAVELGTPKTEIPLVECLEVGPNSL